MKSVEPTEKTKNLINQLTEVLGLVRDDMEQNDVTALHRFIDLIKVHPRCAEFHADTKEFTPLPKDLALFIFTENIREILYETNDPVDKNALRIMFNCFKIYENYKFYPDYLTDIAEMFHNSYNIDFNDETFGSYGHIMHTLIRKTGGHYVDDILWTAIDMLSNSTWVTLIKKYLLSYMKECNARNSK